MPGLRNSLFKKQGLRGCCVSRIGEAKDLWGALVRVEAARSPGAGSKQDCSFWGDKLVPLH